MKKILLSITLIFAVSAACVAQSSSGNTDGSLLSLGIGVGTPYFGAGYSSSLPVNPTVAYEQTVVNDISVGGELSYAGSKLYGFNVNAVYVGARGSYHLGPLLNVDSKIDLYGGVGLGYVVVNVSDDAGDSATASSGLGYGLYAGARYYFTPATAIYAELGYQSLSYLNVGVTFKF